MKLASFTRVIVGLGLAIIFILIDYYLLFNSISAESLKVSEFTSQIVDYQNNTKQIFLLNSSLEKIRPSIEQLNSYMISSDGEVDFINQVETLARSRGLDVSINSVQLVQADNQSNTSLEFLKLEINTKGSFSGTYQFLTLLENLPYSINFDKVGVVSSLDGELLTDKTQLAQPILWQGVFDINILKQK